ncbi:MAG: dTDP-glucose 4,6-dehydratase [Thermodesulfobacteriota bacterium]
MKLLVTGGAGFIGSNFIKYVLSIHPDYQVINLDKLTYAGNLETLEGIEPLPGYQFIKGDICDRNILEGIEFDAVLNFAAETHVDRSILDAYPFLQTNITGVYNLLEVVRQRGCTFLQVSTDEVYGSTEQDTFTEDSMLLPNSPYASSKAAADLIVRSYIETHNVKAIITRCSNNYGPYQFPEKLFPIVILNALNKRQIPVYGDGMNVRDWIYVGDHCKALYAILHNGIPGEIYNIGSRNERTNIDIVKLLLKNMAEYLNQNESELMNLITSVDDRKGHDRRYSIEPSKVEKELGWKPDMDFQEGIMKTIEWYVSHEQWWQRIISGEYREYYQRQYGERLQA